MEEGRHAFAGIRGVVSVGGSFEWMGLATVLPERLLSTGVMAILVEVHDLEDDQKSATGHQD